MLGVSFGGMLALELAARHPLRLNTLTVQGTGARSSAACSNRSRASSCALPAAVGQSIRQPILQPAVRQQAAPGPLFQFVTRQCWQTDQSVMAHRFQMVERFDMHGPGSHHGADADPDRRARSTGVADEPGDAGGRRGRCQGSVAAWLWSSGVRDATGMRGPGSAAVHSGRVRRQINRCQERDHLIQSAAVTDAPAPARTVR